MITASEIEDHLYRLLKGSELGQALPVWRAGLRPRDEGGEALTMRVASLTAETPQTAVARLTAYVPDLSPAPTAGRTPDLRRCSAIERALRDWVTGLSAEATDPLLIRPLGMPQRLEPSDSPETLIALSLFLRIDPNT